MEILSQTYTFDPTEVIIDKKHRVVFQSYKNKKHLA